MLQKPSSFLGVCGRIADIDRCAMWGNTACQMVPYRHGRKLADRSGRQNRQTRRDLPERVVKNVIVAIRDKSEALGLPATHNSYLVKNPRMGKPYNDFQVSFSRALAAVGINDVRINDLRHTYASLLIQNGVSLYEVQKLLGHSSPNMKQRYAHLNPNSLKQIVNNLPSFL